jgi:hypothetical protein
MQQVPSTLQWTNWEAVFSTRFLQQLGDAIIEKLFYAVRAGEV